MGKKLKESALVKKQQRTTLTHCGPLNFKRGIGQTHPQQELQITPLRDYERNTHSQIPKVRLCEGSAKVALRPCIPVALDEAVVEQVDEAVLVAAGNG